jgi:hypothetical protein
LTRPRLVIHIGTHKTGTTTLQRELQAQRATCLQQGVFYAPTDRAPWPELPKHCSVFDAAVRGDPGHAEAERQWLLAEFKASRAHTLLLSEEGLSEPLPRLAEFFAPFADEFDIEVVCFLRRPDLFTEALYNQFVRETARREGRSVLTFSRGRGLRDRLRYAEILSRWQALPARVVALDFDATVQSRPLLEAFCEAAHIPALKQPAHERANSSPDMRLIQLLARMNRHRIAYQLPRLLQAASAIDAEGRFGHARHLLGRQERTRLLDDMASETERLAQAFGVRFSRELPQGEPFSPAEDLDPAYAVELLARLSS